MSLPSFPGGQPGQGYPSAPSNGGAGNGGNHAGNEGILRGLPIGGSGDHLPIWLLACCGAFTAVATAVSIMSITLQLKNYRKPALQRAVVRIMVMVPLYAISSLIALFSLEAAFFIDAVRDLYEAFVIYTFFQLLITYLGGERSLLLILHGRPPVPHPFPFNIFFAPMDVSDPWTLLTLKRGVLQYVQIKPLLVIATIALKATGTYREGDFAWDSGYTYISVVYNTSICWSLYCLAMFWVCVSQDLKPFRPVPKFLCVKGILFFSFWQSIGISFLVAVHAIKKIGPYTDAEHMSLALVDSLICFEMPLFAIAHQYAFQSSDYIDENLVHTARLPFIYAFRDSFGLKDVWQDTKDTLKGSGISYQAYEPAEGALHYGAGRQKRIRAGLRYSRGGQAKYWLPQPGDEARNKGERGPLTALRHRVDERLAQREGYAPLLPKQADRVVRPDPRRRSSAGASSSDSDSDAPSLDFRSADEEEENMYQRARRIGYAGFPNVDVTKENRRRKQREEEDGILAGKWTRGAGGNGSAPGGRYAGVGAGRAKGKGKQGGAGYYGGFADRQPSLGVPAASQNVEVNNEEPVKLFDGDVERPDAWSNDANGSSQMRWTKKKDDTSAPNARRSQRSSRKPSPSPSKSDQANGSGSASGRPGSPFSLGSASDVADPDTDEEVSPSSRSLPKDAVDLVVEDPEAREEMREHERRKGEPQAIAPAHVYLAQRATSDMRVDQVQKVYSPGMEEDRTKVTAKANPGGTAERGGAEAVRRMEEQMEEEAKRDANANRQVRYGSLYDQEENPWA